MYPVNLEGGQVFRAEPEPFSMQGLACWLDEDGVHDERRRWWRQSLGKLDRAWREVWHQDNEVV